MKKSDIAIDLINYISSNDKDTRFNNICSLISRDYYFLSDMHSRNIVIPSVSFKKKIVLTAHYDTVKGSLGYNDNSSGIIALLMMQNLIPDFCEIIFTDNEENHGLGTELYLKYSHDDILFNINVDVIGIGKNIYYEMYETDNDYFEIKNMLSLTGIEEHKMIPFSDSYVFWKHMIPSILFVSGNSKLTLVSDIFKCIHNNVGDNNIELINPGNIDKVISSAINVLKYFDENGLMV